MAYTALFPSPSPLSVQQLQPVLSPFTCTLLPQKSPLLTYSTWLSQPNLTGPSTSFSLFGNKLSLVVEIFFFSGSFYIVLSFLPLFPPLPCLQLPEFPPLFSLHFPLHYMPPFTFPLYINTFLKLEYTSKSSGGIMKTDCWACLQGLWLKNAFCNSHKLPGDAASAGDHTWKTTAA